ncbi:MAG: AbrB/MazE/SpoVT family DNA-binding domain-containing protein [Candidatus Heimdallarchaeota archaeon]
MNSGHNEEEYVKPLGAVTVSKQYSAVLPRKVRELLDAEVGDTLFFFEENNRIYIANRVLPLPISMPEESSLDEGERKKK